MPHVQTIPAASLHWEHNTFEGRRLGEPSSPAEEARLRWWGVNYGAYASEDDAKWLRNPLVHHVPSRFYGPVMDRFFFDESLGTGGGQHTMTEARMYAAVRWYFTGNPTAAELALTENMEFCRTRMAGAVLFADTPYAFTVTVLPAERAPEGEGGDE